MATNNAFNNQINAAYNQIILNAGTNGIAISTDAASATLNIGTGAAVKAVTLGSSTASSTTTIQAPSAGVKFLGVQGVAVANKNYVTINTATGAIGSDAGPSSSITITGDSGGGLTGSSFTFTGGSTGLTFAGAGSTETLGGTLAIANGGTNATSMTNTDGVVYYDGTRLVTTTVGTAGQLLTSNGAGVAPTFQTSSGTTISITGDTGGALTSGSFTFTGGTTGLTFSGSGTTETLVGTLVVANGGTGRATLTNHGVLVGAGTSAITQLAVGSSGTVLIGNATADPSFSSTPTVTSITINNAPSVGTDGANKAYVDSIAAGLDFKNTCFAASTTSLTVTYANGVAGVGATLTNAGAQAAFSIDGTTPVITSRILIKNQASSFQNGIYNLTVVGTGITNWVLTRSLDYNTPAQIAPGDIVPVSNGTVNADTFWLETATVTTIGTDPITFSEFFGGGAVTFNADSGSATPSAGILTIAGGSGISTSATGSTVTVSLGSGVVQTVKLQLTSTQVKNLHATPVTIIAAQGAGTVINIISILAKLNYGGTNPFIAVNSQVIYLVSPGLGAVFGWVMDDTDGALTATANTISYGYIEPGWAVNGFNDGLATVFENVAVQVSQNAGTEISGNAANNNTIDVTLVYQVLTL